MVKDLRRAETICWNSCKWTELPFTHAGRISPDDIACNWCMIEITFSYYDTYTPRPLSTRVTLKYISTCLHVMHS